MKLKKTILLSRSYDKTVGLLIEKDSPKIMSTVTRDILSLMAGHGRLKICSPSVELIRSRVGATLDVDFVVLDPSLVKEWIGYYEEDKPIAPRGVRNVLWKKVVPHVKTRLKMRPGTPLQLPDFDLPRLVPPGSSPSGKPYVAPTNAPSQMPSYYPWLV